MKRYWMYWGPQFPVVREDPEGEWVGYADAQKEITELRQALEATRADWEAAVQENLALRKRLGLGHTQD